jgi:hypothetical protein
MGSSAFRWKGPMAIGRNRLNPDIPGIAQRRAAFD